jgi:uncharacterized protein
MPNETLDRAGRSQLHYAARDGDVHAAARLIRAGADITLADKNGYTPLHCAAQEQQVDVANLLLDRGGQIDLFLAVLYSRGRGQMIRLLRQRGADPFIRNTSGVSPLELARGIANYDMAQYFKDLPK